MHACISPTHLYVLLKCSLQPYACCMPVLKKNVHLRLEYFVRATCVPRLPLFHSHKACIRRADVTKRIFVQKWAKQEDK